MRFTKGSPEALEWAKKMREARGKKMAGGAIPPPPPPPPPPPSTPVVRIRKSLPPRRPPLTGNGMPTKIPRGTPTPMPSSMPTSSIPNLRIPPPPVLPPPPPPPAAPRVRVRKTIKKETEGTGVGPRSRLPESSPASEMAGAGIVKDIAKGFKKAGQKIKSGVRKVGEVVADTAEDVGKYGKAVIYGRKDYPPKVRNILKKYADEVITGFKIKRTPVSKLLTGALSAVSLGEFGKRFGRSEYDDLFHLFLEMNTASGKRISVEKNEVINMDTTPPKRDKEEVKEITTNIPSGLTIGEMMDKAEQHMGKGKFFGYSARDNNCQDFIVGILRANNIGDSSDIQFVKQNTKQLFKNLPFLRKVSNTITDIGAKANVITTGAGMCEIEYDCEECPHCKGMGILSGKATMRGGTISLVEVENMESHILSAQSHLEYIMNNIETLKETTTLQEIKSQLRQMADDLRARQKELARRFEKEGSEWNSVFIDVSKLAGDVISKLNKAARTLRF